MTERSSSPPSRYRSQRKARQQTQEETPAVPDVPQDGKMDDGVTRSRSRYHRKTGADARPPTGRPTTSRDQKHGNTQSPSRDGYGPAAQPSRYKSIRGQERQASPAAQAGAQDVPLRDDGYGTPAPERARLNGRSVKQAQSPPAISLPLQEHASSAETPSGELFPPMRPEPVKAPAQPVFRDGPPQSSRIKATKSVSELPIYDGDSDGGGGGCFGLFKRKRGDAAPAEKDPTARPARSENTPRTIKPGGRGAVPGTDIPESAVNASDRRVTVRLDDAERSFPVTPNTTLVEIIKSADTVFSASVNVKSAVLLEYFRTVGVQRPLRRYERIRDVVNSWDNDRENSLLLIDPGRGTSEVELSIAGVPKQKPEEQQSWLLSYSQKPGKWEKRYIVLHPSGQITQQKDINKPQSQENVAHLSDFDIYTPTSAKAKKVIKPPKRFCYAVKSQQKSAMFESTLNFVHFFCTSDKATSDSFYNAVQGWRSWYLVNVMGEGGKAAGRPADNAEPMGSRGIRDLADQEASIGHTRGEESFSSHYQLGSFKPLIDVDQFENQRPRTANRTSVDNFAVRPPSSDAKAPGKRSDSDKRDKTHLSTAVNAREQLAENEPLANLARTGSTSRGKPGADHVRDGSNDFAKDGLLGRSYTQRQKEYAERERARDQPFTHGSNLLNGGHDGRPTSQDGVRRNASTRQRTHGNNDLRRKISTRNRGSVDLQRSGSRRVGEKPLVDLTPEHYEPPQHSLKGKGKGYHPTQLGPGGLIDSATSPEDPLGVPASTDWRGRNAQSSSPAGASLNLSRTRSASRPDQRPNTSRPPDDSDGPFTGEGLLAGKQAHQGWGGGDRGRGVMDGSRAKGPMLDLNEQSKFVPGSLLNRVETQRGREGPVIDREKRVERTERYGEGY